MGALMLKEPMSGTDSQPKPLSLTSYCRSEAALSIMAAELVANGISSKKISQVMETLHGKSFFKSTVPKAYQKSDEMARISRKLALLGERPLLTTEADCFELKKIRGLWSGMVAYVTNSEGDREMSGFSIFGRESKGMEQLS